MLLLYVTRLVLGLTEIVERLAKFVGPSKNDVPVEFIIPQIISEVNTSEESLALVTEVLLILQVRGIPHKSRFDRLPFQVVAERPSGAYIWQGTSQLWTCLKEKAMIRFDVSDSKTSRNLLLQKICIHFLDVLSLQTEPIVLSLVCEHVSSKLKAEGVSWNCRRLSHVVRCVSAILIGVRIIKDFSTRTCLRYLLNTSPQQQTKSDMRTEQSTERAVKQPRCEVRGSTGGNGKKKLESWTVCPFSVPVELGGNTEVMKVLQNPSMVPYCTTAGMSRSSDHNTSSTAGPMHAALLEVVGNDISTMQIVDILRNESMNKAARRHPNIVHSSESFFALPMPEWMMPSRRQPTETSLQPGQFNHPIPGIPPPPHTMMMQDSRVQQQQMFHGYPNCQAGWRGHPQNQHGAVQRDFQTLLRRSLPNHAFQSPSHFENVAKLLKDAFATQSKDFLTMNDQDRVQQYARLKQF